MTISKMYGTAVKKIDDSEKIGEEYKKTGRKIRPVSGELPVYAFFSASSSFGLLWTPERSLTISPSL